MNFRQRKNSNVNDLEELLEALTRFKSLSIIDLEPEKHFKVEEFQVEFLRYEEYLEKYQNLSDQEAKDSEVSVYRERRQGN
ncbi:hypothetical protein NPIL_339041 [Nephila pilipes]|uniref:Uncharacterized protein n=1 Tax=Nephila pilipes TaxID=299642 RepID=A0A8X6MU90_NEPPI|nr:hypothetical protein NPIL_339041 [Nephila pilipes]